MIHLPEYGFNCPLPAAQFEASAESVHPAGLAQVPDHVAVRGGECPADFLYFVGTELQDHGVVPFPVGAPGIFSSHFQKTVERQQRVSVFVKYTPLSRDENRQVRTSGLQLSGSGGSASAYLENNLPVCIVRSAIPQRQGLPVAL